MIPTRSGTPSPDAWKMPFNLPDNPGSLGASLSHFVASATACLGAFAIAASLRLNANTKTAVFSPLAFFLKEGASRGEFIVIMTYFGKGELASVKTSLSASSPRSFSRTSG